MKKIAVHARHRNQYLRRQLQLDLFAWEPAPPPNVNRAALIIAKRFGLSVDHAGTVTRLAGIRGSHNETW